MTERKKTLVVYHGNCTDGHTAAWAAWLVFGDSAEYLTATYSPTDIFDVDGRDVFILDYCPRPRDEIEDYHRRAKSLRILDHHKTSKELCDGLDYCTFDMNKSGAGLAWDYFHGTPRPLLVDYVEDRDIWNWALRDSKVVSASLLSYPLASFEEWSELADKFRYSLDTILSEGQALLRAENIAIKGVKDHVVLSTFMGCPNVPVVNTSGTNISEILNQLALPDYFAVAWYQRSNGTFKYSIRSKGTWDCTHMAEKFGGGGHKYASAFVSDRPPWDLKTSY